MNAITLKNLSKIYPGGKAAVDSVSLQLKPGEIFGFLGPNGAGKTTTVKLLTGMLAPTSGSCHVFGMDPRNQPEKIHALSGVVTEHAQMYDPLTGLENLVFYGSLFGLSPGESRTRGQKLLAQLNLSDAENLKLSAYSTGMRQRLSLARALIHGPKVLFLDEPTSGLDPESAQGVHTMIRQLAQEQGCTVFLCTHQLRYAQEICTRYGLLAEGRLLAEGTLEELRGQICSGITVTIRSSGLPASLRDRAVRQKEPLSKICDQLERECLYEISIRSEAEIPSLVRQIVEADERIYQVLPKHPSLEDIYFTLTNKKEAL